MPPTIPDTPLTGKRFRCHQMVTFLHIDSCATDGIVPRSENPREAGGDDITIPQNQPSG